MARLPGTTGDYVWIGIGLAMIVAGLLPMASSDMQTTPGGPTYAEDVDDGRRGVVPTSPTTPPSSPAPTLPDLPFPPVSLPNGTAA